MHSASRPPLPVGSVPGSAPRSRRSVGAAFFAGLAALSSGFCTTTAARAQSRTFYLDRLQLSGAPQDGLAVWRPRMAEKTEFFASGALGYTLNPLRTRTVTDTSTPEGALFEREQPNPIEHQLVAHLSAGVQLMNRVSVGFTLPVALYQQVGDATPPYHGVSNLALHDLRFDLRARLVSSDDGGAHLGAGVAVWAPTSDHQSLTGDEKATVFPYLTGEVSSGRSMFFAGHIGPHFRPAGDFPNPTGQTQVLDVGSELRYSFGAFFPSRNDRSLVGISLWGTTGIEKGRTTGQSTFLGNRNTDLEWLFEWREALSESGNTTLVLGGGTRLSDGYGSPDLRVIAMLSTHGPLVDTGARSEPRIRVEHTPIERDLDTDGDGYPDSIDRCPTIKEDHQPPNPSDGCPIPPDRDGDGIPDAEDKCPDEPEDKDGVEDSDGCPEDNDKDGILDAQDACPRVPGLPSPEPDKNGCPKEHKKIVEEEGEIKLLEPIQFETAKSTIKPVSYPILDEVVDVLNTRKNIRIAIHGHTDNRGGHDMNMTLSRDRAAAVLAYITGKGIDAARLESAGFGPDKPVDTNDTAEGRQKNRRVEFKILE